MPSPEEMRELAQEIVASHRSRRQVIASMQAGVKSQLAGYEKDHQAMAKELHTRLKADKAALMADTGALMNELAEGSKTRQMGVRIQLTGFRNDHQAMGQEVRAELAQARSQLKAETGALMKGLEAETKAARRAWQQGLKGAPLKPKRKPKPRARSKPSA